MVLNAVQEESEVSTEIFELNADEQEHVAGGPEVTNDPGEG